MAIARVSAGVAAAALVASAAVHVPVVSAAAQVCPSVAVVAARGSGQSDYLDPTSYSPASPWLSNGYEEANIRAFLQFAEARHRAQTGESLLKNVQILALDESVYPGVLPLPLLVEQEGEGEGEAGSSDIVRRAGEILAETPLHTLAVDAVLGFHHSVTTGMERTIPYLDAWEAETGCTPGYLLVGYSQGAVVLTAQESELEARGRLVGALYFGNPLQRVNDVNVTGDPFRGNGLLSGVPALSSEWRPAASGSPRLNYCASGDFACDLSWRSVLDSVKASGGVHAHYFINADVAPTDHDAHVADIFRDWVTGYTSQP